MNERKQILISGKAKHAEQTPDRRRLDGLPTETSRLSRLFTLRSSLVICTVSLLRFNIAALYFFFRLICFFI